MLLPMGPLEIATAPGFDAAGVLHGFTTLRGEAGVALARTRDVEALRHAAGFTQARALKQVHGANVVRAEDVTDAQEADAVITARDDLLITIQTADCVPVLLHDRRTGALGAVHAGWRGLAQRVATAALRAMTDAFGTRAPDVDAVVGPAIGPCCFEVGDEVLVALEGATPGAGERAGTTARGRPTVNLWQATARELRAAGVSAERVLTLALCTHCHPELFPSFRRDGGSAGRMYAFLGRKR